MPLKLKKSPLPDRINPAKPLREWIWTEPGRYDGVLAHNETALLALLKHSGRLLRLTSGEFCMIFDEAAMLDPKMVAAIPLRRVGPETYVSYDADNKPEPGIFVVEKGIPKQLSFVDAVQIEPISFWDFSSLSVIKGLPLPPSQIALPKVGKPQVKNAPNTNEELQALIGKTTLFKNIRTNIGQTKDPKIGWFARSTGNFAIRLTASIAIILIYIFIIATAISTGASIGPIGFVIAISFLIWYFGLFGTSQSTETYEAQVQRGPSLFDKLRGMALWNTSFGNKLRREIQRHLDEVNNMIDRGDIDRALKRAMSIAKSEERKNKRNNPLMTALPKSRANLDFDLLRQESDTVSLPGHWGFDEIRAKYERLAEDLSAKGDHRRAAFIYAELLGLPEKALTELEQIKAYEDAAKLATARKLDGATISRLWFLAGKKEIALLIARRHNCMETLAAVSEKDPEFSAYVRRHWVEDLITEGDFSRAVEESADIPQLADIHLRTLGKAIGEGQLMDTHVLERAVQNLPWQIAALNGAPSEGTVGAKVETELFNAITDPKAGEIRQRIKIAAKRMEKTDPRKAALTDGLIRAALAFDADTPYAPPAGELRQFAESSGCKALAEDLRQIHRAAPTATRKKTTFPLSQSGKSGWTMVAALHGGAALVATPTGETTLIDASGRRCWTDHMPDLVGLIPIGPGRLVILVQGHQERRRISLLDTARRTYRALGHHALLSWANYAEEGIWQIQTPTAIGALDLTRLLSDDPAFELLWSITQTVPVKVIAFCHSETAALWLTQRIDKDGPGLLERWSVDRSWQNLSVCLESESDGDTFAQIPHIWRGHEFKQKSSATIERKPIHFYGADSNYETERELLIRIKNNLSLRKKFAEVTTVPFNAAYAIEVTDSDKRAITLVEQASYGSIARLEGHDIATQSATRNGDYLVILTKDGLSVLCDFKSMSVVAL